jgi:hypothetical protein
MDDAVATAGSEHMNRHELLPGLDPSYRRSRSSPQCEELRRMSSALRVAL